MKARYKLLIMLIILISANARDICLANNTWQEKNSFATTTNILIKTKDRLINQTTAFAKKQTREKSQNIKNKVIKKIKRAFRVINDNMPTIIRAYARKIKNIIINANGVAWFKERKEKIKQGIGEEKKELQESQKFIKSMKLWKLPILKWFSGGPTSAKSD